MDSHLRNKILFLHALVLTFILLILMIAMGDRARVLNKNSNLNMSQNFVEASYGK